MIKLAITSDKQYKTIEKIIKRGFVTLFFITEFNERGGMINQFDYHPEGRKIINVWVSIGTDSIEYKKQELLKKGNIFSFHYENYTTVFLKHFAKDAKQIYVYQLEGTIKYFKNLNPTNQFYLKALKEKDRLNSLIGVNR